MHLNDQAFMVAIAEHAAIHSQGMDNLKVTLESLGIGISADADIVVSRTGRYLEQPSSIDAAYLSSGKSVLSVTHVLDGLLGTASDPLPEWTADLAAELIVWMLAKPPAIPTILRLAIPSTIKTFRPEFTMMEDVSIPAFRRLPEITQIDDTQWKSGVLPRPCRERDALEKDSIAISAATLSDRSWTLSPAVHSWANQLMHVMVPRWSGSQMNCACCA